ncbi:MAG TPA: hypothetical protein PLD46_01440 [Hyphomicrobium sp.]|nr:hypothetical protein [Hyphomicrobium sp.]
MYSLAVATWALAALYSDYPGFLNRDAVVEAYTDRGAVVELIIRCPIGTGILSYSKLEGLYCSAKHRCSTTLQSAVDDTCR